MSPAILMLAIETLGDLLEDEGLVADLAVIGGGALLLGGFIERPTGDLDAVALYKKGQLTSAHPLPAYLRSAVERVGAALDLQPDWLNGGPTDLLRLGLPDGFIYRATTKIFGSLTLRIAARFDQIHFKLYAAVDQGPRSKHTQDLLRLRPTRNELEIAASWCRTHDPSDGFNEVLMKALETLGREE